METASVGKKEAARRLIVAAIKMAESGEDPLPIYLIGMSAWRTCRDILQSQDRTFETELIQKGLWEAATAFASGSIEIDTLPKDGRDLIVRLSNAIQVGDVQAPDEIAFDHEKPWEVFQPLVDPANFLKHADRDPFETISEALFDPDDAIAIALTAYCLLYPSENWPDEVKPYFQRNGFVDSPEKV